MRHLTAQKDTKSWLFEIRDHPIRALIGVFVFSKLLFLFIAFATPGQGYDSSTALLSHGQSSIALENPQDAVHASLVDSLISKLVRWDAIYFTKISQRGYVFEQEWAFGWGFTRLIQLFSKILPQSLLSHAGGFPRVEAVTALWLANVSHLGSVLVIYHITNDVFAPLSKGPNAFVTAVLHTISPAGLFLSAPYAESLFSLLSFLGFEFYRRSLICAHANDASDTMRDVNTLISSVFFSFSIMIRSNGLLNGTMFIYDIVIAVPSLWSLEVNASGYRRLITLGIGGLIIATGGLIPQWAAYLEFCPSLSNGLVQRSWCTNVVPSIYTWVQTHYWNVGFLRYWTISNLPLFGLAAPMVYMMIRSSLWTYSYEKPTKSDHARSGRSRASVSAMCLRRFALPQLLLSTLAVTNYHVQIITRLSSGYIVWYWWVASTVGMHNQDIEMGRWKLHPGKLMVIWMVMYGVIQAGLFASFLPPA